MRLASVAVLAVVAAALAGCTGTAPPPEDKNPPGAPPPEPPLDGAGLNTTRLNDTSTVEVHNFSGKASGLAVPGVAAFSPGPPLFGTNGASFDVKQGLSGFVVEVVWNGSDQATLAVSTPCENAAADPLGASGMCPAGPPSNNNRTSPAKIVVVDAAMLNQTGSWSFGIFPQQNVQGLEWQGYVSFFYGAPPSDKYTAVPKP